MKIKRRDFLEKTGLGLLTLGIVEQFGWQIPQLKQYQTTLAEENPRKLALLIGINNYSSFPLLKGCLTDVDLQRELLIYRFGFQPQDILTLTDAEATRENIETSFEEHLIKQAKSGDVVVFHFSGYGSKVKLLPAEYALNPTEIVNLPWAKSLIPMDNMVNETANHILLDSLAMLGRSLLTNKLTMILDTSYQATPLLNKGILPGRTLEQHPTQAINQQEIILLKKLLEKNNLDLKKWQQKQNKKSKSSSKTTSENYPLFNGSLLTSKDSSQIATEIELNGTNAGLLTYYLTQYLWQTTPASNIFITYKKVNSYIARTTNNTKSCQLQNNNQSSLFTYYVLPAQKEGAEGFITQLSDNNTVKIKLLGLPHNLIQNYGLNSWFTVADSKEKLQIQSQSGLEFQAKVQGDITNLPGKLIHEWIRIIPKNISLTVALDSELTRIEKVDSTSAFSLIDAVSLVINKGEQTADCILSKTKEEKYQLLDLNGIPLVNTIGIANEAVKLAVKRLENTLNTILALKLWNLTINDASSTLGVKAILETLEPNQETILQLETKRYTTGNALNSPNNPQSSELILKTGTKIQYRLENYSDEIIYFLLVGLNSRGNPFTIYIPETNNQSLGMIPPRQTLIFPEPNQSFNWTIPNHQGISQTNIIFSKAPFVKTMSILASATKFQGGVEKIITFNEPLKVSQAILEDLHEASAVKTDLIGNNKDVYALDVNNWATFNFIYGIEN